LAGSGKIVERRASIGHESVWMGEGALTGIGAVITRAVVREYEPPRRPRVLILVENLSVPADRRVRSVWHFGRPETTSPFVCPCGDERDLCLPGLAARAAPPRRAGIVSLTADAYLAASRRGASRSWCSSGVERMSKSQIYRLAKSLDEIVRSAAAPTSSASSPTAPRSSPLAALGSPNRTTSGPLQHVRRAQWQQRVFVRTPATRAVVVTLYARTLTTAAGQDLAMRLGNRATSAAKHRQNVASRAQAVTLTLDQ
jgi:hypothetical protein